MSFQIRVLFIGLRGRILVNLYWKTFRQKVLKNTEEFLMQDVLKEEGGKGNHFEIPPANFLSEVDRARKRRLALFDTPAPVLKINDHATGGRRTKGLGT